MMKQNISFDIKVTNLYNFLILLINTYYKTRFKKKIEVTVGLAAPHSINPSLVGLAVRMLFY